MLVHDPPGRPAGHLRRLIEQTGSNVRQLTAAAGVPENRLAYWVKPGTALTRMPTMQQIHELAQIIGCSSGEVYRAFRADVDGALELPDELSADERALLTAYRRLGDRDRPKALQILKILNGE